MHAITSETSGLERLDLVQVIPRLFCSVVVLVNISAEAAACQEREEKRISVYIFTERLGVDSSEK